MRVTEPTKFIALFDIHIGWERIKTRGNSVIRPTHAIPAINAVMEFAADYKPQALVLPGDQLNCGPISHWLKGKPRLVAGFNLRKEMDELDRLILKPFDKIMPKDGIKIWHNGNHEVWIQDFIDQNPGTEGLLEPEQYLKLEERGYKIYEQGEVSSLGKLNFVHGDVVLRSGNLANPARMLERYRRNMRAGHLHTLSAAVDHTAVDARDFHTNIIVPSLSTRNPSFIKNNPNCFINGFLHGIVYPDGSFFDHVIIINKGKFEYAGKIYDGNK